MNSISRKAKNCPRTTRATSTHMVKPMAKNTCQSPLPNAMVMARTMSSVGNVHTTWMNQLMLLMRFFQS